MVFRSFSDSMSNCSLDSSKAVNLGDIYIQEQLIVELYSK